MTTNNTYYENTKEALSIVAKSTYNFASKIAYNSMHAIQPALYAYLGAATLKDLPITGQVKPIMPILIATSNIVSRCQETSKLVENDKHAIAHHHHEIMADYIVSLGIAGGSYLLTQNKPDMAFPIISTFLVTDITFSGDNSPIEHLKLGITSGLDLILGDLF